MTVALALISFVTLAAAGVAMALRNLIHSALLLVVTWSGIAAFYLWCGAEFAAFAQVLVYVGAISMVVLFAVLLTRRSHAAVEPSWAAVPRLAAGLLAAGAMFALLAVTVLGSRFRAGVSETAPSASVRQLGLELMGTHGAAVLLVGVLLTVALLGAMVLAAADRNDRGGSP